MSLGMTMGTFSIERVGIIPFLFWVLVFLLANGTFYGRNNQGVYNWLAWRRINKKKEENFSVKYY